MLKDKKLIPIFGYLLVYGLILGAKLIFSSRPFYDWDESLYIQTGKEMFANRFFLFPVWQGDVWLDKPPLIPFLYWSIAKIFFFIQPEISTRLFSLGIAIIVLVFVYLLYLRAIKKHFVSLITVVFTSLTPLFLQRAQTVNLDIFILLGWIGYLLFYENFVFGAVFILIGVMSKSLLGFYPIGIIFIYHTYLLITKNIDRKKYFEKIRKLFLHTMIAAVWFIFMLLKYGLDFWNQHIIESHFRRVTASIESHFGQKTFYIDLIIEQMGPVMIGVSLIGLAYILYSYFFSKKIKAKECFFGLFLLPWFIFLNLTKTKIFWYLLPALPQFAFLAATPLLILKNKKKLYYFFGIVTLILFLYPALFRQKVLSNQYSDFSDHYRLSLYAKSRCPKLLILMSPQTRETYHTLSDLGLTITTTHWWGEHPSMVYYFAKPLTTYYSLEKFKTVLFEKEACYAISKEDLNLMKSEPIKPTKLQLKVFGDYLLFKDRF